MEKFDSIIGKFECPKCGAKINELQTKETDCNLACWCVGDFIPELVGQYRELHPYHYCRACKEFFHITFYVIEGILVDRPIDRYDSAAVRQLLIDTVQHESQQRRRLARLRYRISAAINDYNGWGLLFTDGKSRFASADALVAHITSEIEKQRKQEEQTDED